LSDLKLKYGKEKTDVVYIHQALICARFPIFLALLYSNQCHKFLKEFHSENLDFIDEETIIQEESVFDVSNEIIFPISLEILNLFLKYIYTDQIPKSTQSFLLIKFLKKLNSLECEYPKFFEGKVSQKSMIELSKILEIPDKIESKLKPHFQRIVEICESEKTFVSSFFSNDISQLLNHEDCFSDYVILSENSKFFVHKIVLCNSIEYFDKMFKSKMEDSLTAEYVLEVENESVAKDLLNFIYSDNYNLISKENAINLLVSSTFFEISNLKQKCEHFLRSVMDIDNVLVLYEISVDYNSFYLRNYCINFFTLHFEEVIQFKSWRDLDGEVKSYLQKVSGKKAPKEVVHVKEEIKLEDVVDDSGKSSSFSLFKSTNKNEDKNCVIC
jgi:hypothetical protein